MSTEYKVHEIWLKEIEFKLLVLEMPTDEVEDKLTYFSNEKLQYLTKSFYEDFLLAELLANTQQLVFHIKQNYSNKLIEARNVAIAEIIKVNPLLTPEKLMINENSVIKIIQDDYKLKETERLLTDSKNWNTPYIDEITGVHLEEIKPDQSFDKDPLENLEFEILEQWWDRVRIYINVKKFNEKDTEVILRQKMFYSKSTFQMFIINLCMIDLEELVYRLEEMGVSSRVEPAVLMSELYNLCKEVNPFLTYEKAGDLNEDLKRTDVKPSLNRRKAPNRIAIDNSNGSTDTIKVENKKTFKDVPVEKLLSLSTLIKEEVIGQEEAIESIVEAIQRASVGLKEPDRPIGSFLLAGSTGCGKTLSSKVLADKLIGDSSGLITIDCSEYSADHEYTKLIGAAAGYVGYDNGGILTNAVIANPFAVIVFDELEKASNKVFDLMLQILEEGRLTDNKGTKVSFKDTIIIMTSNVGVAEVDAVKKTVGFGNVAELTDKKKTKAIDSAIKSKFKPEFINRIDAIVNFKTLTKEDYKKIIDLELGKLIKNLKRNMTRYSVLDLKFDKKIKNLILKKGIDEKFGARPLRRYIEKEIATPLASILLKTPLITTGSIVNISSKKNIVTFNTVIAEQKEEDLPENTLIEDTIVDFSY